MATDPNRLHVSGQSLASTPVGKPAYFTISNVTGTVEDVEVNVEGTLKIDGSDGNEGIRTRDT